MEGNTSHPGRGVMKESGDNVKSWIRWGISWFPTLEDCNKRSSVTIW